MLESFSGRQFSAIHRLRTNASIRKIPLFGARLCRGEGPPPPCPTNLRLSHSPIRASAPPLAHTPRAGCPIRSGNFKLSNQSASLRAPPPGLSAPLTPAHPVPTGPVAEAKRSYPPDLGSCRCKWRGACGLWPAACAPPWPSARRGPGRRAPPPSAHCTPDLLCCRVSAGHVVTAPARPTPKPPGRSELYPCPRFFSLLGSWFCGPFH